MNRRCAIAGDPSLTNRLLSGTLWAKSGAGASQRVGADAKWIMCQRPKHSGASLNADSDFRVVSRLSEARRSDCESLIGFEMSE